MDIIFKTQVGKLVGTDAALIFSEIARWVHKNKANDSNFHDGKYWAFNTKKGWVPYFDGYFTERQIKYAIDKLKKAGLIERGEYNKLPTDRTSWYTLTALGWSLSGYEYDTDTQRPFQQTRDDRSNGQPVSALTNIITYQYNNIPNRENIYNARTRESFVDEILQSTQWVENQIKEGITLEDVKQLVEYAYDSILNTTGKEPSRQDLFRCSHYKIPEFKERKRVLGIKAIPEEDRKSALWAAVCKFADEFDYDTRYAFAAYYAEKSNNDNQLMRFEEKPNFDILAKLRQWKQRDEQRNKRTSL